MGAVRVCGLLPNARKRRLRHFDVNGANTPYCICFWTAPAREWETVSDWNDRTESAWYSRHNMCGPSRKKLVDATCGGRENLVRQNTSSCLEYAIVHQYRQAASGSGAEGTRTLDI